MLLLLNILVFFFFFPLTAWAYFDPGFGGYLVNSILSLIVTGFAFVSAAVIYFFRTIIGKRLLSLWRKYEKLCLVVLLTILGFVSFFLGAFLHHTFYKPTGDPSYLSGARIIDSQRMYKGYSLYDNKLINEKGQIVKQWHNTSLGLMDKNGDFYGAPYIDAHHIDAPFWGRYSWDDKIIWEKRFPIHHMIYLSPMGTVFTFSREEHKYNNYKVDFDIILELNKNGKELQRYSFWDHFKEFKSYHAEFRIDVASNPSMLPWKNPFDSYNPIFDYFHLNSFFMIPPNALEGKNPAFRPGNWLISLKNGSMVFILDHDTKQILWHMVGNEVEGSFQEQHSVSMLPNGNILLFDNGVERKASRILIIDPLSFKIKWQYNNTHFFSKWGGFVQALPNGNFLVTSSLQGYVFEVTPDKKIVWEYYAPNKKTNTLLPEVSHDHLDTMFFMIRYDKELIDHLLTNKTTDLGTQIQK